MASRCTIVAAFILGTVALAQSPRFEPAKGDLSAGAAFVNAWADVDGDNDLDLFVGFNGAPNRLYRNDPDGLKDVASAAGLADARATRAAAWGDADGDGDPDLLVGFAPGPVSVLRLYRNTRGTFTDVTEASRLIVAAGAVRQVAWVDVDRDADLDLFVAFRDRANAFFVNTNGVFFESAERMGLADARKSVGAVWFDYDEDNDLDLYVANMDGDANGLFVNHEGRFNDLAKSAGLEWGGRKPADATNGTVRPCVADVNGDGLLDLFMANYGANGLFLNRGRGKFEDVSEAWGVSPEQDKGRYDACAFADFDNDGRLDLYLNGTVTGGVSYRDYLFRNTGTRFEDVTPPEIKEQQADHGVQWADYDRDGDLDLALTGSRAAPMPLLFTNLLPAADARRSLHVRVTDSKGVAVQAGAEVRVFSVSPRKLLGLRVVDSGSGYNAQNDMPVHFGLPSDAPVDVVVSLGIRGRAAGGARVNPRAYVGKAYVARVGR